MTTEVIEVVAGAMVHGGVCLARHDGRTVMVRLALPGERVRVRVHSVRKRALFADVVEVMEASADRVQPPCPVAGVCGGCDLQHARVPAQRAMKAGVIVDALRRQGRLTDEEIAALGVDGSGIEVRALPTQSEVDDGPLDDGLGWRSRARWQTDDAGRPGFYAARSHDVVPIGACPIALPVLSEQIGQPRAPGVALVGAVGTDDSVAVLVDGQRATGTATRTRQEVGDRVWRIGPDSFWQPHIGAPSAYVEAVVRLGAPQPGEHWWDLYAGAGLFSAFLAEAVGAEGSVDAVEGAPSAVRDARRALHDLTNVRIVQEDARRWVAQRQATGAVDGEQAPDGIVVDPPRTGLGEETAAALAAIGAGRVIYVACDPVAFARDAHVLIGAGYRLTTVESFDAFPMTHHVELIARFDLAG